MSFLWAAGKGESKRGETKDPNDFIFIFCPFLEEAEKMNTLEDILDEANYKKDEKGKWSSPKLVATEFARL